MSQAVHEDGMETWIAENDLEGALRRRVFPEDGFNLLLNRGEHVRDLDAGRAVWWQKAAD